MEIVAKVGDELQQLFGEAAERVAAETWRDSAAAEVHGDLAGKDVRAWDFCTTPRRATRIWRRWPPSVAWKSRRRRSNNGIPGGWSISWRGCFVKASRS